MKKNLLLFVFLLLIAGYQSTGQNIRFQNNVRGGFTLTGNCLLVNSTLSFLNTAGGVSNSSSADLVLPPNSTIVKAFLYVEAFTNSKINSVWFRVPGGSYTSYTATSPGFLDNPGTRLSAIHANDLMLIDCANKRSMIYSFNRILNA